MAEGSGPPDRIHLRDLSARCVLGVGEDERRRTQPVKIDITLDADLARACKSDRLEDTVDYAEIEARVLALVSESSFFLVERLAEEVAATCLRAPLVRRVRVRVGKPGALRAGRTVEIEIVRPSVGRAASGP